MKRRREHLFQMNIGNLCNGSTADSDSVCGSSKLSFPARKKHAQACFFQLYSPCGEFYCFAVIFGLRRVVFASRVLEANIISLRNEVEQYHCRLRQYHADEVSISLKAFDSEVFQNFVDAFRAFRVCRQIRTGESLPPRGRWHAERDGRSLRDFEI